MNETCAINGCQNVHFKVGLCESHFALIAKEALRDAPPRHADLSSPPLWRSAVYVFNRLAGGMIDGYRRVFQLEEEDLLQMYLDEADSHLRNGVPPQALESLLKAASLAPQDVNIQLQLGVIHTSMGHFSDAVAALRKVQEIQPDHPDLDERLGEALCGLGQHSEAIERLQRAAAKSPDSAERQHRLGAAFEASHRPQEAIAAFARAAELVPTEPRYQQALGFVHEAIGDHEAALRCFKKAIELER